MKNVLRVREKPKIRTFHETEPLVVSVAADKREELDQRRIDGMVRLAVDSLGGVGGILKPEDRIVLKPNMSCCYPKDISGITTDVRVVGAFVKLLAVNGMKNMVIAESTGINVPNSSEYVFRKAGLRALAEEWGMPLIDIKKDSYVEFEMPGNRLLKSIRISKTVYEADALIDLAVMKGYPFTQCCKNLHGILPDADKPKMHKNIKTVTPELANSVRPTLCVVDGIYGSKNTAGERIRDLTSVKFNTLLASKDPLAVDSYGASLWGYDIDRVECLDFGYAERIGVGVARNYRLLKLKA